MNFDTQTALREYFHSHKNGQYGIQIDSKRPSALKGWEKMGLQSRPRVWKETDNFLCDQLGYSVKYEKLFACEKGQYLKTISRYTSDTVKQELTKNPQMKNVTENELLKGANVIAESLNLRNTTATKLPDLQKVGDNLTIDASSKLKDLSGLKKVGGKITVLAKNPEEMKGFLEEIKLAPKLKEKAQLLIKNYV